MCVFVLESWDFTESLATRSASEGLDRRQGKLAATSVNLHGTKGRLLECLTSLREFPVIYWLSKMQCRNV